MRREVQLRRAKSLFAYWRDGRLFFHNFARRLTVSGTDSEGRRFQAAGEPLSWVALPLSASYAAMWVYLVRWDLDGEECFGEIQDVWPHRAWSAFRRWQSGGS